jgi:hypothetical protein
MKMKIQCLLLVLYHHHTTSYYTLLTDNTFKTGPITEDDFFKWSCLISGPTDTPFEGGVFEAELSFPRDYPLSPPKVLPSFFPTTHTLLLYLHSQCTNNLDEI